MMPAAWRKSLQAYRLDIKSMAMRITSAIAAASLTAFVVPLPAYAASSGWHDSEGGRIRLVTAGQPDASGQLNGVLQIDLKPGWKTYWRDPGDSGVPPQITVDGERIREAKLAFPAPVRHDDGYSEWAGYDRSVLLPVSFTLPDRALPEGGIAATVLIGICEKICVPVHADLVVEAANPTHAVIEEALVRNAQAALPGPATPAFGASLAGSHGKAMTVAASLPQAAQSAELFVAGEDGYAFGTPVAKAGDGKFTFEVPVLSRPAEKPSGEGVPYTLTSSGGAVSGFLPYP